MLLSLFNDLLMSRAGLDPQAVGLGVIEAAVRGRMQEAGCPDERSYLSRLQSDPAQWEALVLAVTVPETWFFREPESFTLLKKHLAGEWAPSHPGERLRILSVPCCTGEEPYSIAMTLLDLGWGKERFTIDAFDINPRFLARARGLEYPRNSFRGQPPAIRQDYFIAEKDSYRLRPEVGELVRFGRGDLLAPDFLADQAPYPVIFCRNLLIYLHAAAQKRAVAFLDRHLAPGGLLFTGHAESVVLPLFKPVDHPFAFAYRRAAAPPPAAAAAPGVRSAEPASRRPPAPKPRPVPALPEPPAPAPAAPAGPGAWAQCWEVKGVSGDQTCPQLKVVSHCRNCAVFSRKAREVFDREPPAGYEDEWAARLAAPLAAGPAQESSVLIFRVGPQWLAVAARLLKRISGPQPIHSVPHRRGALRGVANIEGEFHLVFDLAQVLGLLSDAGMAAAGRSSRVFQRLIILRHEKKDWAFCADEIWETAAIDPSALRPEAAAAAPAGPMFAKGFLTWGGREVMLIDESLLAGSLQRCLK